MTLSPTTLPAPPRGRFFLLSLSIDGSPYDVRPIDADPSVSPRAFRLTKPDGTRYDLAQTPYGPTCDCPDFIFRRDGIDPNGCKHVRALVSCGLIQRDRPTRF